MKKYLNKLLFALPILISLISCESNSKNWEIDIKSVDDMLRVFDNEVKLKAEIYIGDTIHLLNPFDIRIVNDYFLVQDIGRSEGGILSVFDMTNKQFVGKMLNYGNGPNELLGLRMNLYGKDTLLALDPFKKTSQLFGANELKACNGIPFRTIKYQSPNKGEQIDQSYLFENMLICSGQFQKGRFQLYNNKGQFIHQFGEFPNVNFGENQLDNIQLGSVFGASASFCGNSPRSQMACLTTGTLTIYNYRNDKNEFSRSFFCQWFSLKVTDARYIGGKPVVRGDNKANMVGAGKVVANDKYLFFTFSDFTISDIINMENDNRYKYILVTDWDGEPVAKIVLDKAIHFPLQIDKEGKYLYAIHTDLKTGFAQIIRYDISFLK
ncbi:MAG TPA: hypothetical protein DHV48_10440 [Prolixibacteraceae bacterium]|nr:hypothetical protein [Prolixibacteraceae bacterium]